MLTQTLSLNRPAPVRRAPAAPYVPVALRAGLGFRSAYRVPTPRPNMLAVFMYEAMLMTFAWWTAQYERVGVHARSGGTTVVGSYVRRRSVGRLSRTVPDAVVADLCGRYDAYGSDRV